MLSSAIFRRLGTEDAKGRVLSGQSLQLKSKQVKAELERKCKEGLKLMVLFGAEKKSSEIQSHYLRLPQLIELPVVVTESKWTIFVAMARDRLGIEGLREGGIDIRAAEYIP